MRPLSILLNIAVVTVIIFPIASEGIPDKGEDILVTVLLIFIPIVNLYVLLGLGKNGDWVSLYLKRKAMEEKSRIEELQNKKQ